MPTVVEELLATWREGERLLEELPPLSPDRETVMLCVAALKVDYASLTDLTGTTTAKIRATKGTIERARMVLSSAKERLTEPGPDLRDDSRLSAPTAEPA